MITVEVRINGQLISHIYAVNKGKGEGNASSFSRYDYEEYQVGEKKVRNGRVYHDRTDGSNDLLLAIFKALEETKHD